MQLQNVVPLPNHLMYLLPMSWDHNFLAIPSFHQRYDFLAHVGNPTKKFITPKLARFLYSVRAVSFTADNIPRRDLSTHRPNASGMRNFYLTLYGFVNSSHAQCWSQDLSLGSPRPPVMRAKGINYQRHYRPDRVTAASGLRWPFSGPGKPGTSLPESLLVHKRSVSGGSLGCRLGIAPSGRRSRSRSMRLQHFVLLPNHLMYLLPMSWHHNFLAIPSLH